MTRPYSTDLRERVVGAVGRGEMSRPQAGVGISTPIKWMQVVNPQRQATRRVRLDPRGSYAAAAVSLCGFKR